MNRNRSKSGIEIVSNLKSHVCRNHIFRGTESYTSSNIVSWQVVSSYTSSIWCACLIQSVGRLLVHTPRLSGLPV